MAGAASRGAIIAQDTFETYSPGSQLNGQNGGSGFGGPYVVDSTRLANATTVSQSLSYSSGSVTNNGGSVAVLVSDVSDSNNLISRPIPTQSSTVYFSFLLRANTGTLSSEDFLQLGLSDVTTTEPKASVGIAGTTAGALPEQFYVRVPNGGTSAFSGTGTTVAENTTYMLVGKISKVAASSTFNQVDLFVNPSTTSEPGTATATSTVAAGSGVGSVSNVILRMARTDTGDQYLLDNLRFGTSYSDVVPEPGTLGVMAVAGAGWLLRRRRVTAA